MKLILPVPHSLRSGGVENQQSILNEDLMFSSDRYSPGDGRQAVGDRDVADPVGDPVQVAQEGRRLVGAEPDGDVVAVADQVESLVDGDELGAVVDHQFAFPQRMQVAAHT